MRYMPSKSSSHNDSLNNSLQALQELINNAERSLCHAKNLVSHLTPKTPKKVDILEDTEGHVYKHGADQVIEGIFDGQDMIGADKKTYPVPANYASKSKIVEGSKLKCTIKSDGSFQYKIIKEGAFSTSTGTIIRDGDHFIVVSQDGMYQLLPAAVTYIRARVGDRVAIRIPKVQKPTYAAIEARIPSEVGLAVV
jgi:hypothetical protein